MSERFATDSAARYFDPFAARSGKYGEQDHRPEARLRVPLHTTPEEYGLQHDERPPRSVVAYSACALRYQHFRARVLRRGAEIAAHYRRFDDELGETKTLSMTTNGDVHQLLGPQKDFIHYFPVDPEESGFF